MPGNTSALHNHCFIYALRNHDGQRYAWKVDIQRAGKLHIHLFEFAEYGGEVEALNEAEAMRNQLVLKMPVSFTYENRQRLMPHNTSGHPGVYRIQSNNIQYWRATTRIHGYNLSKSFRIDRYGEEQAKQMDEAIKNHKHLEEIVRKMREITQTQILESVPGVTRRKPLSEIPKAG